MFAFAEEVPEVNRLPSSFQIPEVWREKAIMLRKIRRRRIDEEVQRKVELEKRFLDVMIPNLRRNMLRRREIRINNNAMELVEPIFTKWHSFSKTREGLRRKIRLYVLKQQMVLFALWRQTALQRRGAKRFVRVIWRKHCGRSFSELRVHCITERKRSIRLAQSVHFSIWSHYYRKLRRLKFVLRQSVIHSCKPCMDALKRFAVKSIATKKLLWEKVFSRKRTYMTTWTWATKQSIRATQCKLRAFKRFLKRNKKLHTFKIWKYFHELNLHAKKIQCYARRWHTKKLYKLFKTYMVSVEKEREKIAQVMKNGMFLKCFHTLALHKKKSVLLHRKEEKSIKPILRGIRKGCPSYRFVQYGIYLFGLFDVFEIHKIDFPAFVIIKKELGFLIEGDELAQVHVCEFAYDRRDESVLKNRKDSVVVREDFLSWLYQNRRSISSRRFLYRVGRMYSGAVAAAYVKYALPIVFYEKAWRAAAEDLIKYKREYKAKFHCRHCQKGFLLYRKFIYHENVACFFATSGLQGRLNGPIEKVLENMSLESPKEIVKLTRKHYFLSRITYI
jgi:hypothetical protein